MAIKKHTIELTVNGKHREGLTEPRRTLADFLRDDLGLTVRISAASTASAVLAQC